MRDEGVATNRAGVTVSFNFNFFSSKGQEITQGLHARNATHIQWGSSSEEVT